jgi:hypothetical protein
MKRKEGESFEDYKERRREANLKTKNKLKGINVFPGDWGTYRKDIDGEVESRMKHILDKIIDKYKNQDEQQ